MERDLRFALFLLGVCIWMTVGRFCGLHNTQPPLVGGLVGYPLMTLGAALIFFATFGASQEVAFIRHPTLVYLGKISYGLYAFHILALRCAYYLFRNYHHAFQLSFTLITSLAITLIMAATSFRWLEAPFLGLKQQKFTYVPSGQVLEPEGELSVSKQIRKDKDHEHLQSPEPGIYTGSISGQLTS